MMITLTAAAQQQSAKNKLHVDSVDVAVTFSLEHAQVAETGTPSFWLKGCSADTAVIFYHGGLGIAVNLTGEHASNIENNMGLSKIAFMTGSRYAATYPRCTGPRSSPKGCSEGYRLRQRLSEQHDN